MGAGGLRRFPRRPPVLADTPVPRLAVLRGPADLRRPRQAGERARSLSAGLWGNILRVYGGGGCIREWATRAEQLGQACDTWVRRVLEGATDHKVIGCLSTEIRRACEDARRPLCECGLTICRGAALYESAVCSWTEFGPFTTLLELAEVFLESQGY